MVFLSLRLRAAIYCRVSTEEQAREGFSIAAQRKTLLNFCSIKEWDAVKIYTDEGASGKNTKRPAFQRLLTDADGGLFDLVLVWKINRFSRKNSDLLNTVEYLNGRGINLVSCCEQFDASTPSGRLMLSMLGTIGEFERETIVENIRSGMTERAEQGLFNGGRVLGYDSAGGLLTVNGAEAETVREIFDLYLEGWGYKSIADKLEAEGRRTKNGCAFSGVSVKRILKNPIYAGRIEYNRAKRAAGRVLRCGGFVSSAGRHQRIISQEEFARVQRIMDSGKQAYAEKSGYLLSSLLRCPLCRGRMTGHTTHGGNSKLYRYYVCTNYKGHTGSAYGSFSINADMIENAVLDYVCSALERDDGANTVPDESGGVKEKTAAEGRDALLDRAPAEALCGIVAGGKDFRREFAKLDADDKRKLLRCLLKEIDLTEDKKLGAVVPDFHAYDPPLHRS